RRAAARDRGRSAGHRLVAVDAELDVRNRPLSQWHPARTADRPSGRRHDDRRPGRFAAGRRVARPVRRAMNYRIVCVDRDGQWIAQAERPDTGDPFGIEWGGPTREAATARLTTWLSWQAEHADALEALQQAERAYHRTIAGSAFASPTEGPSAIEM